MDENLAKKYTKAQIAEFIELFVNSDGNCFRCAMELGIPKDRANKWLSAYWFYKREGEILVRDSKV